MTAARLMQPGQPSQFVVPATTELKVRRATGDPS